MYVCICNALRERDVREVAPRCLTAREVYNAFDCTPRCAKCVPTMRSILAEFQRLSGDKTLDVMVVAAE